jgi:hypothetical protein
MTETEAMVRRSLTDVVGSTPFVVQSDREREGPRRHGVGREAEASTAKHATTATPFTSFSFA